MVNAQSPVQHTPARIVKQILLDLGASNEIDQTTTSDWPTYVDYEPEFGPESAQHTANQVAVLTTTPVADGYLQFNGRQVQSMGIQVITRTKRSDASYTKMAQIINALVAYSQETLTIDLVQYLVHSIRLVSGPVMLGRNDFNFHRHSSNLLICVTVDL